MPTVKTRPVRKDKPAPLAAVYDANGNLVGAVDPDKVARVAPHTAAIVKGRQLRKSLHATHDAPEQARIARDMNAAAAVALRGIHNGS